MTLTKNTEILRAEVSAHINADAAANAAYAANAAKAAARLRQRDALLAFIAAA